ncbi:MAG: enoyl-CoA hydratase/isomerase family protein [Conexivisphaerales archaeon]
MEYTNIIAVKNGETEIIYFNREDKLNTITIDMVNEIRAKMEEVKSTVKAVVIGGKKNFSAGADINQFKGITPMEAYDFHVKLNELAQFFRNYEYPVISFLNGYVLGGGLELSLSTDIRICSNDALLGQPEINLGINAGAGGNVVLPRVIGRNRALYMILTGEKINAHRAYEYGLVDIIANDPEGEAIRIAKIIEKMPAMTLKLAKKAVNRSFESNFNLSMDYEATIFGLLFSTDDTKDKIEKFFKK